MHGYSTIGYHRGDNHTAHAIYQSYYTYFIIGGRGFIIDHAPPSSPSSVQGALRKGWDRHTVCGHARDGVQLCIWPSYKCPRFSRIQLLTWPLGVVILYFRVTFHVSCKEYQNHTISQISEHYSD